MQMLRRTILITLVINLLIIPIGNISITIKNPFTNRTHSVVF